MPRIWGRISSINVRAPGTRPARPHLERWYQRILSSPASRAVLDLSLT